PPRQFGRKRPWRRNNQGARRRSPFSLIDGSLLVETSQVIFGSLEGVVYGGRTYGSGGRTTRESATVAAAERGRIMMGRPAGTTKVLWLVCVASMSRCQQLFTVS